MKRSHAISLSTLSGLLLAAAWPANGFVYLLFVALLPLFYVEQQFYENPGKRPRIQLFVFSYLTFFVWNALTTFWVSYSTLFGGIMAVVLNAFFMTIVFYVYHVWPGATAYNRSGQFILLFYWIAWEYFHLDWDLSWPWLNLGNGFSAFPQLIQWYEYTGVLGGTAWIITINILIFRTLYYYFQEGPSREILANGIITLILLAGPILFSQSLYEQLIRKPIIRWRWWWCNPITTLITEQYERSPEEVLQHIFELAEEKSDRRQRALL
ncbi:MAG: hypothetical protein U5L09_16935 [Bacteroidales bacterium]|nr:hypothetical protein [Bacteroidales bacterium]